MSILDFDDYKAAINNWIAAQPRGGHGQLRQISQHLGVNSVVMSQIFRGDRDLTLEQAVGVADFIGMSELEREYFLLLIQKARAGTKELKDILNKQLLVRKESTQALKNRIKHEKLNDEDRATFYSHWYYSAIRLGVSIPELRTVAEIADHLSLDRSLVAKVVDFLLEKNLIVKAKHGMELGPQVTHLGHDSPFVMRHRMNWRVQGLKSMENQSDEDLFYSGPMVLSDIAAKKIRKVLINAIETATKEVTNANSETLRCLNVDWFRVGKK
ncbi:hypothetical protein AZI86_14980 [Bdellovibrio bacteriovorus]|uniref:DUF4423 domain-containing protein n=1 Tax=Bdellovibrio bacteriovorus TaxID=959 RepID=A0A150WK55_BDEBC|nr:TIGR02147 family protein [Bdellovibrio bacteriovorus]KYG64102.1 hypothetical protein AZI86_14980 [Bdellovibrio bacteriovorus]